MLRSVRSPEYEGAVSTVPDGHPQNPADSGPAEAGQVNSGLFGAGWSLAAAITALAVYLASAPGSGPIGPASDRVLLILGVNLLLIAFLLAAAGWRVLNIVWARSRNAGARLHLRFVTLFALVAVAPAVVVALTFGALVTSAVDNWFSRRVEAVVENSAKVAKSYLDDQQAYMQRHLFLMAGDVNDVAPGLQKTPLRLSQYLALQANYHEFPAVYLIDSEGRVLARAEGPGAPAFSLPPPATLKSADKDIVEHAFVSQDLFRAVYRLKAFPDAYLYVARFVEPGMLNQLRGMESSVVDYREADTSRQAIQAAFALSYVETALLVLVGAVWLGMAAANSISAPVGRLVQAADRVAAGNLDARVELHKDPEEIAVLSRAFNRMTSDLQAQQKALRRASIDAESRRRFIETVLAGVSAGVVGVDEGGAISAANSRALALLDLDHAGAIGRDLSEAAPELAAVAQSALQSGRDAEDEADVVRHGEGRRLRVRASGLAEGGMVITFDDITRLVAAQRNAAWRDVARRIAHEIKNPLTPIQLSAERIRRKYRGDITHDLETFDRCTDTIVRQVEDIGRMVDEFSSFARMPAPKFETADLAELLRQAVFARRVASPDVTVSMDEPDFPATLKCDARMVGQALTNVLKNAAEAVQARVAQDPTEPGEIQARLVQEPGRLSIVIEDNGVGLPAKDRDRLTEPYVTTREKGTGLGLAIVKRIMEEHGGALLMQDAPTHRGAQVILQFAHAEPGETLPAEAGATTPAQD
ncbi:MAG TPA: PAS domain-containing sensor histidine kinase [Caulobacteraceae bacterium]|nr:PAS domain-containing sensor histidine kinase [Caulobacteraceae bacterium]